MTTNEIQDEPFREERGASAFFKQADTALRENPVPAILTAVAIGFGIGLLVRALEPEPHPIRDRVDEASDYLRALLKPLAKKSHHASEAVREAVESAVSRVNDFDADDYVKPMSKWWRRLWS